YKDFPLQEIHPWAMHAAIDANCLLAQSEAGYWDFVDYVHAHAQEITGDKKLETATTTLDKLASAMGLKEKEDPDKLHACITKQDATAINAAEAEAHPLRIEATPTLFINGEKVDGALPKEQLEAVIDRAIAAGNTSPTK